MKNLKFNIIALLFVFAGLWGCVNQEFDAPELGTLPEGENITIKDLMDKFTEDGGYVISEDKYLIATVVGDESSGTFYKELYVQDETGGLNIKMEESANNVSVGDVVKIVLKDLTVNDYNELVQLQSVEPAYDILVLENDNFIEPKLITYEELVTLDYTGQLIKLEGMQFVDAELSSLFAPEAETVNRTIQNCNKDNVTLRSSGYSNFHDDTIKNVAPGNGSIIAIASRFGTDPQIYIRNINEVDFEGERCAIEQVDPVSYIFEDFNTLEDYGDPEKLAGWKNYVSTGDRGWQAKEFPEGSGELYVQASGHNSGLDDMQTWLITPPLDLTSGDRAFGFMSSIAYWEHASGTHPAKILISTDYDGANVSGATWTELDMTIAGETSGNYNWVKSEELDLSAYAGTGYIAFAYTGSDSESTTFAVDNFEFGEVGTTSYAENTVEVDPVATLAENFNTLANYGDPADLDGWRNILKVGSRGWQAKDFDGDVYVQASGYNSGLAEMETWLITPPLDLTSGDRAFGFESSIAYWEHETGTHPAKILISTNYDGSDVEAASWTELSVTLAGENSSNYTWIKSEEIDLSAYAGTGYIAFTYTGSDTESTTFAIDNFEYGELGTTSYADNGGGGGTDPVATLSEDFNSLANYDDAGDLEGWLNYLKTGDRGWQAKVFDGNSYVQSSGYNSGLAEMETWLITPALDMSSGDRALSFKSAIAYWEHTSGHPGSILISTDFDGENVDAATWTELTATLAGESSANYAWIESGEIDLSAYSGTAYIAFAYIGSDTESTSFIIDDVVFGQAGTVVN